MRKIIPTTNKFFKYQLILFFITTSATGTFAQCQWQTVISDGFEYQTVCPYLIPGTTVHNTPQTFAVHSGNYSLYLNFINCSGGTGTCAGDKVFERGFSVCRNESLRFSAWLTTSFSGLQCNMKMIILDGNGDTLDVTTSIVAPYSPQWIQYQSSIITPSTDSVIFSMITNVGGGNGNDLSIDDFLLEKCPGSNNSTFTSSACDNAVSFSLFDSIPVPADTTGTWAGPSVLGGGYSGTFTPGSNAQGTYVYTNPYFGLLPGCPLAYDTVIVDINASPVVTLGADTTLCTNQSVLINAGNSPGQSYLWNNGVTGPNVLAFTNSTTDTSVHYSVVVTNVDGCSAADSIIVNFIVCSGVNSIEMYSIDRLFPVPAFEQLTLTIPVYRKEMKYEIVDPAGRLLMHGWVQSENTTIPVDDLSEGIYMLILRNGGSVTDVRKFTVSHKR